MLRKQLITKTEIAKMPGIAKTHFLNDTAKWVNKSLGDVAGLDKFGFHIIEIPIGALSTEFHRHYIEEECVYILEGSGVARIGNAVLQVEAGDFIGYPAGGEPHDLRNTGSSIMKLVVVGVRLAYDIVDYPKKKGKRMFRCAGRPHDMVDIAVLEHPEAGKK